MSGKSCQAACTALSAPANAFRRRLRRTGGQLTSDAGMSTAEYAVGTVAACGFAAVLYKVVTSGSVSAGMRQLIERALDAQF
ncbi:hypothetical protein DB35_04815 [Streptomyces abyssalis]|uniref:DUF4244 domain-containing protein n=1 Tax=Streptomyces abyssalis TaxID=933944 RepID=A0A1E7JQE6_9ACTN|nr:DUF4244 domain-containing protein [Streptomyces abyssalis]OEU90512.1 hypothetical protein AN215_13890 [Streptomyces abyssalis]OEU95251.1 hypothetical protein DB35_04815 [Streptomyces abyssalis]OEV29596.1 hypothetical protein AN219_15610 [Streptomyces nanshensis]